MRVILTLKVLRVLGVLLAIWMLLPFTDLTDYSRQPLNLIQKLIICTGIFTLIPFSRLRRAAIFWPVLLMYAVVVVAFIDEAAFVLNPVLLFTFVVLVLQFHCICILRRYINAV
jgi:hypothetical protein